jgi:hypothetical protein
MRLSPTGLHHFSTLQRSPAVQEQPPPAHVQLAADKWTVERNDYMEI